MNIEVLIFIVWNTSLVHSTVPSLTSIRKSCLVLCTIHTPLGCAESALKHFADSVTTRCQCGSLIRSYSYSVSYILERKIMTNSGNPSADISFEAERGIHHVKIPLLAWVWSLLFKGIRLVFLIFPWRRSTKLWMCVLSTDTSKTSVTADTNRAGGIEQ